VYLFALRVCSFTGSVVKGKPKVCSSSTCVLFALRVYAFTGGVVKGKPRVCSSSTCVLFALQVCGLREVL
jgi:hypothetical protein